jgi:dTMP kinase
LRSILLEGVLTSSRAEALLFMADRAEQIESLIEPTLATGRHVVCDRYAYSSIAYQGFGRGLDAGELRQLSDWALAGTWPDVVVLVDVPADVASRRRVVRGTHIEHLENDDMQRRVVEGFRSMASEDPSRWAVVDGTGTIDEVAELVWKAVSPRLH